MQYIPPKPIDIIKNKYKEPIITIHQKIPRNKILSVLMGILNNIDNVTLNRWKYNQTARRNISSNGRNIIDTTRQLLTCLSGDNVVGSLSKSE